MRPIFRISVIFLGLLMQGLTLWAQGFHTPSELLNLMYQSDLNFELLVTEKEFDPIVPGKLEVGATYQLEPDGRIFREITSLKPWEQEEFFLGETYLEVDEFAAAREQFESLLPANSWLSSAMVGIGRSYQMEKEWNLARKWFEKAIDSNFYNFRAHQYLAEVLTTQGEGEAASAEIALAWVLNRTDPGIENQVSTIFRQNKRKLSSWTFQPKMVFLEDTDTVFVLADEPWMGYAVCKSFWNYEEGYRRSMTGSQRGPNILEEQECLFNLISMHTQKKGKEKSSVPEINQLIRAKNANLINEFIFFEIWLYQEPLVAYTQPQEVIEGLRAYVLALRGE